MLLFSGSLLFQSLYDKLHSGSQVSSGVGQAGKMEKHLFYITLFYTTGRAELLVHTNVLTVIRTWLEYLFLATHSLFSTTCFKLQTKFQSLLPFT